MIGPVSHLDEARLGWFAEDARRPVPSADRAHLDTCARCRRLLDGHRLAIDVLSGPWERYETALPKVDTLVVPRAPVRRSDRRRPKNGFLLPAAAAITLIVLGALGTVVLTGRALFDDRNRPAVLQPSPSPDVLPRATLRPGSPDVEGGTVLRVDASTGGIRDAITLGGGPGLLSEAGGYLWAFNFDDGSVAQINAASSRVVDTLQFDDGAAAILGHGDDLWVTADQHDLLRINARTGDEIERFVLGRDTLFRTGDAGFLAYAGGSVWVTVPDLERPRDPHELWRIDPDTGDHQARLSIDRDPQPLVTLDEAIYAASPTRHTVTRIDAATNLTTSVRVGAEPVAVADGAGSVWVAHDRDLSVWRLDPDSLSREARIEIGEPVHSVAFGGGRLWATTWTSLHEIDPNTNRVVATTRLLNLPDRRGPAGVLVLGDSVWVGIEAP